MSVVPPVPPVTVAQPLFPVADCCHCIVPVCPVKLIVVLAPLQTVPAVAVAVPPTLAPFTVTDVVELDDNAQTPLVTNAL